MGWSLRACLSQVDSRAKTQTAVVGTIFQAGNPELYKSRESELSEATRERARMRSFLPALDWGRDVTVPSSCLDFPTVMECILDL